MSVASMMPSRLVSADAVYEPCPSVLPNAALLEEKWRKIVHASEDAKEGPLAWKEKRKPVFKGK